MSASKNPRSKPIRLGFIGLSTTGWAATALAPPLFRAPLSSEFSLVAVSTRNADSAQASAKKYSELASGTVKAYHGSAEHIAADRDVDMLVVAVRVTHHKEVALKVIEGGKDLFIEWPIGRNLEETKEIYEAFLSAVLENQIPSITVIDDGGKPTGEIISYDGPHQICVSGMLVSGAVFNVHIHSGAKNNSDFNWVINGDKGTIRIRDDDRTRAIGFFDASPKVYLNENKLELEDVGASATTVDNAGTTAAGLAWKALADGKAGSYATLEQGLKTKELIAAIKKSSKEGTRIHL